VKADPIRLLAVGRPLEREGQKPETRYARNGPVSIAYQVLGDAAVDLVLVPGFVSHVEVAWENRGWLASWPGWRRSSAQA
jgi:hypothetical protein